MPESYFIKTPEHRKNLLTLPSHELCNKRHRKWEDRFRANVLSTGDGHPVCDEYREKNSDKSARHFFGRLHHIMEEKNVSDIKSLHWREWDFLKHPIHSNIGGESVVGFKIDRESFTRVIWKIAQGHFFYLTGCGRFLERSRPRKTFGPNNIYRNPGTHDEFFASLAKVWMNPTAEVAPGIDFYHTFGKKPNENPFDFYFAHTTYVIDGIRRYFFYMLFLTTISAGIQFSIENGPRLELFDEKMT